MPPDSYTRNSDQMMDILRLHHEAWAMLWLIDAACWHACLDRTAPPPGRCASGRRSHGQLVVPDPIKQDTESGLFA